MLPSYTEIKDLLIKNSKRSKWTHRIHSIWLLSHLTVPDINDQIICLSFNVIYFLFLEKKWYFHLLSFNFSFFKSHLFIVTRKNKKSMDITIIPSFSNTNSFVPLLLSLLWCTCSRLWVNNCLLFKRTHFFHY